MTNEKSGSVLGGSLLITGSCIGAGMLGLPILTGFAGLLPSILMFILAWALMTGTALLLVEVGGWFSYDSNFPTMIGSLLGNFSRAICFILYLFLFYSLLVAYIADSGIHFSSILQAIGDINFKTWMGSTFFVSLFGWVIYLGTKPVDLLNRFLMVFKIISFFALIFMSLKLIQPHNLTYTNFKYTFFPLPILIISFGFHNMIPTITHYLAGDIKRVKKSIIIGSLITLSIYLIWIVITLGSIPISGDVSITSSYKKGYDAAKAMQIIYPSLTISASILAFTAILTSFLAQSMSVSHFLCDGLKIKDKTRSPFGIILLTFIPPLIIAQTYPAIFYKALSFGGMVAVVLFGLFPVLMVYKGRYIDKKKSTYKLFGGKISLVVLAAFSIFIVLYRVLHHLGLEIFPIPN